MRLAESDCTREILEGRTKTASTRRTESSQTMSGPWFSRSAMVVCRVTLVVGTLSGRYCAGACGSRGRSSTYPSGHSSHCFCPLWSSTWYKVCVLIRGYSLNPVPQGAIFPELTKRVDIVKGILNAEEESFSRTLDDGQRLLDQYTADAKRSGANHLGDEDVWSLYNTYGFPISLTRLIAEERGLRVKEQECERTEAGTFGELPSRAVRRTLI
jgi:hypothetical protein